MTSSLTNNAATTNAAIKNAAMNTTTTAGPAWDLSAEYSAADAPEIDTDLARLDALLMQIAQLNDALTERLGSAATLTVPDAAAAIAAAQTIHVLAEDAGRLLHDPDVFASCLLSVNARDASAQALEGRLQHYQKRFAEVLEPRSQFLKIVPDDVIEAYLNHADTQASTFAVRHARARRDELLTLREENLANALSIDGIGAWGRLYSQLSGTLTCDVLVGNELQTMGIAQAGSLMQTSDVTQREAAWRGINQAWERADESCAAAINAIAGWRLEMCRKRSKPGKSVHFLDGPAHANHISRATLDALMDAAKAAAPLARRAATAMARAYGRAKIGPWDTRAPAPTLASNDPPVPFNEAIDIIANAYAQVHPDMGAFVRMMADQRWIEGTVSQHKSPGAYCTGFAKSRTSRIYMTYAGSMTDVITLAHELGHAFHSWVMRDLPDSQRRYGMSLAETASTFGETTVRDALLQRATSPQQKFAILWEEVSALPSFLLNIPARFSFERAFYEAREARPLRPAELKALMSEAWQDWYGDCLSEPDPMFWASKLHFFIADLSFYNFPYSFGYLFSLGVYQRRADLGDGFYPRYVALLRDTGRCTAEEIAAKHLGVQLDEPTFWRDTVARMAPRVTAFEALVDSLTSTAP